MGAQAIVGAAVPPYATVLSDREMDILDRGIELAAGGWFPEFAAVVQRLADANGIALLVADEMMGGHPAVKIAIEAAEGLAAAMRKHDPMHSPHEGWSVIFEELEELREHVRDDTGRGPDARKEALQVAAMGMRYALDLCEEAA